MRISQVFTLIRFAEGVFELLSETSGKLRILFFCSLDSFVGSAEVFLVYF